MCRLITSLEKSGLGFRLVEIKNLSSHEIIENYADFLNTCSWGLRRTVQMRLGSFQIEGFALYAANFLPNSWVRKVEITKGSGLSVKGARRTDFWGFENIKILLTNPSPD